MLKSSISFCSKCQIFQKNLSNDFRRNLVEAKRYSSYRSARDWEPDTNVNYEITSNPSEWRFVDRLLPCKYIPEPSVKDKYASGWWPQNREILSEEPYVVRRSKNHMIPVYLTVKNRGMQKRTVIRHIKGDIWRLEHDVKQYLEKKMNKKCIGIRVDEVAGKISFRGDYVHFISEWFKEKGL